MNLEEIKGKIIRNKWLTTWILILIFLGIFFAVKYPKNTFTMISCIFFGFFSAPFIFGKNQHENVITISKYEIKTDIKDYSFLAPFIVVILIYMSQKFLSLYMNLTFLSDFSDLFVLTLTLILVYGTFCLLSFNLISVLRDYNVKKIKNELNYEYMDTNIDKSFKSGLLFLAATIFSSLGCLMLYAALLLSKTDLSNSFLFPIYNVLISYGFNECYYLTSVLFILLSVFMFIRGIITSLNIFKDLYIHI